MLLDPCVNVVGSEAKMTADPVVGDRVAVSSSSASVDEGLRHAEEPSYLFDVQVLRSEEWELLRRRLFLFAHLVASCPGK
jgi:hypothetical protein